MAVQKRKSETSTLDLGHPIYLDIEMLLTFLAAIEDGVAHSSEVAVKVAENQKTAGEGSAGVKLPSITSLLGLSLNVDGKLSREKVAEETVENKMVRQHTSASLFNRLRRHLRDSNSIVELDGGEALESIKPGTLVEVIGVCEENPLLRAVAAVKSLMPFVELELQGLRESNPKLTNAERKDLPASQVEQRQQVIQGIEAQESENAKTARLMEIIEGDLRSSPIVDLVLRAPDFSVIVSAGREYFTEEFVAGLKDGTYKLIGKVNAVSVDDAAEVPVTRRGGIGLISGAVDDVIQKLQAATAETDMSLSLPDSRLRGRYLQVVPLAIYI